MIKRTKILVLFAAFMLSLACTSCSNDFGNIEIINNMTSGSKVELNVYNFQDYLSITKSNKGGS